MRGEKRINVFIGYPNFDINRFELYIDARDIQREENESLESYKERLKARGQEKLNECYKNLNFEFKVNPKEMFKKYNLGDKITAISSKYKLKMDALISEYTQTIENGEEKVEIVLGEPKITFIKELKRWLL